MESYLLFIVLISVTMVFLFVRRGVTRGKRRSVSLKVAGSEDIDHKKLEEAERALAESNLKNWLIIKRLCGPGYNHNVLAGIIAQMGSEGIEATYDSIGTSSADMGPNNYVLKVHKDDEERALAFLDRLNQ